MRGWPFPETDAGREQMRRATAELESLSGSDGVGKVLAHYYIGELESDGSGRLNGKLPYPRGSWDYVGAVLQVADVNGLLAHRLILTGDGDDLAAFLAPDRNTYLTSQITFGPAGYGLSLAHPMPEPGDFDDGVAETPWAMCLSCLDGYRNRESDMRRFAEGVERFSRNALFASAPYTGTSLYAVTAHSNERTVVVGLDAIRARSVGLATEIAEFKSGKEDSAAANQAYMQFYETEVAPVMLSTQLREGGCFGIPSYPNQNHQTLWERYIDNVTDFMDCRSRVSRNYDFENYTAAYPAMKAEADALHAKSFGIEKRPIPTPEAQLASLKRDFDQAEKGLADAYASIDGIVADRQNAEEQRRFRQRLFADVQAGFERDMKQVRDNQLIVRPNGTLTTYGEQNAFAEEAQRIRELELQEAERQAIRRSNRGSSSSSSVSSVSSSPKVSPAPVGNRTLFIAVNHGEFTADRCSRQGPYGILKPDEPTVRCSLIGPKEIYVLGATNCESFEGGMAEGSSMEAMSILRIEGLTDRAAQELRRLAAKDLNEPFAAESSLIAARRAAESEWSRKSPHPAGVARYYATRTLMDASAKTLGCNGVKL